MIAKLRLTYYDPVSKYMFVKVCLFAFLHVIRGRLALNPDFYVFNLETMNEVSLIWKRKRRQLDEIFGD